MIDEPSTWRRRSARILLGIGAIALVALLDGWRRHRGTPGATQSITLIVLYLVVSISSAIALRRWPRIAVIVLAFGSIYAAGLMIWTLYLAFSHAQHAHGNFGLPAILNLALTLGILATIPIALGLAWPLRRDVVASERTAALNPDS